MKRGQKQFFEDQSFGKKPTNPDAYYKCLAQGKWEADRLTEEYRRAFFAPKMGDWWGLLQLWVDWEGKRFVLPFLLKWHKDLPKWIDKEVSREELREKYKLTC